MVTFISKGNELFKIKSHIRIVKKEYMNNEDFVTVSSSLQFLQTSL